MGAGVQALAGGSGPGGRLSSPGGILLSGSRKDWRQGSQFPLSTCVSAESGETEAEREETETLDKNQRRQKEWKTVKVLKKKRNKGNKQSTVTNVVDTNPTVSILILNVIDLNAPMKTQRLSGWIHRQDPTTRRP